MIFCCRSLSWVYRTGLRQSVVLVAILVSTLSFDHRNRERSLGNTSSRVGRHDLVPATCGNRVLCKSGCLPLGLTDGAPQSQRAQSDEGQQAPDPPKIRSLCSVSVPAEARRQRKVPIEDHRLSGR